MTVSIPMDEFLELENTGLPASDSAALQTGAA